MRRPQQAPSIADYALLSDSRAAALVSRYGSVDWCCLPHFAADPCFGRLLDWRRGGFCSIAPAVEEFDGERDYLDDSLVLCTRFHTDSGSVRIYDFLAVDPSDSRREAYRRLVRIVEGTRGHVDLRIEVEPRFDFGHVTPWIRAYDNGVFTAVGGHNGLVLVSDMGIHLATQHALLGEVRVREGERRCLGIQFVPPELLDKGPHDAPTPDALFESVDATWSWWREWSAKIRCGDEGTEAGLRRSALVLKGLSYAPTGAIIAAPTTSLPEGLQGTRTWDYRFSWIRDAAFTADVLVELGCDDEAYAFRRFIERSSAGSAEQFQTLYGIDGARRQSEFELNDLEGYRGATPVRVGNQASEQLQLDVFGEMLELSWIWHQHGHSPSDEYWHFIVELIDRVCTVWREPDHGIWEMRGQPQHFVYSKVMCWSAVDRGVALARELERQAPVDRWVRTRDEIKATIEAQGYDRDRGIFVQTFGSSYLDAALLRLPRVGFVAHNDPRMTRTVDAIWTALDVNGLLRRYDSPDGLPGTEGAFLACSFWLVECLVGQGRFEEARRVFHRAASTANDLGLFSEEFDVDQDHLLANYPQGLTHLSYISAGLALRRGASMEAHRRVSSASS